MITYEVLLSVPLVNGTFYCQQWRCLHVEQKGEKPT